MNYQDITTVSPASGEQQDFGSSTAPDRCGHPVCEVSFPHGLALQPGVTPVIPGVIPLSYFTHTQLKYGLFYSIIL